MTQITRRELLFAPASFPFFWRRRIRLLSGIPFEVLRHGRSGRRYLVIHGDESTAREVLREHMKGAGRGVGYIAHGKERDVRLGGALVDPNRMFSREGAEKNLRLLNPNLSRERIWTVLDQLDRDREQLLQAVLPPGRGLVIALHNNGSGYSALDEVPISDTTALHDPEHPHEFFLCTEEDDFRKLRGSPYNVLLQTVKPPEDDGSLSRLAARRQVRYLNLEVRLGNRDRQLEMLAWAEKNLP